MNHRDLGSLYSWMSMSFGGLSFFLSLMMRVELSNVEAQIVSSCFFLFNDTITCHALMMIFLFVMPLSFASVGNFLMPIHWELVDLVFPSMNNLSLTIFLCASILLMFSSFQDVGIGCGWTLYPPLSNRSYSPSFASDYACFSIHLLGMSSIIGSMNFIVSNLSTDVFYRNLLIINPMTISMILTAFLLIVSLPVLAIGITFLICDSNLNTSFLDVTGGGDMLLFQHLFWFFGHPEVYIIIVPVFGITSHMISILNSEEMFGSMGMVVATFCLSSVSFFVWAHHMFSSGISMDSSIYFSSSTYLVAIPTAIKINSWSASLLASTCLNNQTHIVGGFMWAFTLGGFTGVFLASPLLDFSFHDTYFVVAHFHFTLSLGAIFGMAILLVSFLDVVNLHSNSIYSVRSFIVFLVSGGILLFSPFHLSGGQGLPSSIPDYPDFYVTMNMVHMIGITLLVAAIYLDTV